MRNEPHTGTCERCGCLVIDARSADGWLRLDAAPDPDGEHRAWNNGDAWIAIRYRDGDAFHGMRRAAHKCVLRDTQLRLDDEASTEASPADPINEQEVATCAASSDSQTAIESPSSSSRSRPSS
jgi:hypothetical protein